MTKGVVVITSPLPGSAQRILDGFEVRIPQSAPTDESALVEHLREADAAITLLSDPVTANVLSRCPRLKIVANYAVGYDNIDVEAARKRGVVVTNTPGVLTAATADLAMALLLAVTRRVIEGHDMMISGAFSGWEPSLLLGSSLEGKRLGIVGMGRIGMATAERAKAFGMEIVYTRPSGRREGAPGDLVTIDELTTSSDIVSIHCPLNEATRHLFDERRLRAMKRGAFLINTARGPIVDESALAAVLAEGHLAGAGLDVFEEEPEVHPDLILLHNVVLLPHLGSATIETRTAMAEIVATDVRRVLSGKIALHPVN